MTVEKQLIVQLLQISQTKHNMNHLPYSAGLLQAYVLRHGDARRYTFMPAIAERLPLETNFRQAQIADVFGFSVFVWNVEYSLALAKMLKAAKPEAIVIFGGPQVPDRAEEFLRKNPFIDVCVHGEGERVFLKLLEALPGKDWDHIAGISWIDSRNSFRHQPKGERIADLDEIPSPYVMGLFDHLLGRPNFHWMATWETNRGCPFSCTFCDWGSATATKVRRYSLERILADIRWFSARRIEHVNCCDANFGILPRDLEIAEAMIESKQRTGYPSGFFVQGAKNATDRIYEIQRRLLQSGMHKMIDLALQGVSPEVLKVVKRENISLDTYLELQQRFSRDGVDTYTDLLVGLPGETYDSFVDGICRIIKEGQHHWILFHNIIVLPNAELAQPEYRAKHGIESVFVNATETLFPLTQEVTEYKEMLIATATMNRVDWARGRAFAWWVVILYFNFKLLQLPLLLLNRFGGLPLRTIFEFFSEARFENTPMLADLHAFLLAKSQRMQLGEPEHMAMRDMPIPSWMDLEDFIIRGLSQPAVTEAFYAEAARALRQLSTRYQAEPLPEGLLEEALALSQGLFQAPIKQAPFVLAGRYNLWDWYWGLRRGENIPLIRQDCRYVRDWYSEPFFDVRIETGVRTAG